MKNPKKRPNWSWRRPGICAPNSLWEKFDALTAKKYRGRISDAFRAAMRQFVKE